MQIIHTAKGKSDFLWNEFLQDTGMRSAEHIVVVDDEFDTRIVGCEFVHR